MTTPETTGSVRLQLAQVGDDPDAVGIIFPDEMVARANWRAGDTLDPTPRPNGFVLSKSDAGSVGKG
jgi:hypothetical protein